MCLSIPALLWLKIEGLQVSRWPLCRHGQAQVFAGRIIKLTNSETPGQAHAAALVRQLRLRYGDDGHLIAHSPQARQLKVCLEVQFSAFCHSHCAGYCCHCPPILSIAAYIDHCIVPSTHAKDSLNCLTRERLSELEKRKLLLATTVCAEYSL